MLQNLAFVFAKEHFVYLILNTAHERRYSKGVSGKDHPTSKSIQHPNYVLANSNEIFENCRYFSQLSWPIASAFGNHSYSNYYIKRSRFCTCVIMRCGARTTPIVVSVYSPLKLKLFLKTLYLYYSITLTQSPRGNKNSSIVLCPLFLVNISHLIHIVRFCLYLFAYVRALNSSETTGRTNIKLDTVDHHLGVSVIRVFVT